MSMRLRYLATLLAVALSACGTQGSKVRTVDPLEYKDVLAGWWDEGPVNEMAQFCQPGRNLHRHVFSEDGKTVTWELERPTTIIESTEATSYTYRILNASPIVLTLFLEGETRKLQDGELAVWELVVVDRGLFHWRATAFPTAEYNAVWGRRCR